MRDAWAVSRGNGGTMNTNVAGCGTDRWTSPASSDAGSSTSVDSLSKVRGIVLAGVHAWGNCVLEQAVCRPLLPVAGRPLIWHALGWIRKAGIESASVCGNSDTAVLRRNLGNGAALDLDLDYFEDVMPRGPAGCVRDAALPTDAETVVVVDGTIIPGLDLLAVLAEHRRTRAEVTLVIASESDGAHEHEPTGVYVFARSVLEEIPASGYQDIKETLIPALYRRGARISTYVVQNSQTPRVTDAASYLNLNLWCMEHATQRGLELDGYNRVGDAWVHVSARVSSTARLVGPVLVGPNTTISSDVLLIGPVTIGMGCTIGSGAVVTRSAIWDRCEVGQGAVVDQCVLADGAKVDADLAVRETACVPRNGRRLRDLFSTTKKPSHLNGFASQTALSGKSHSTTDGDLL